MVGTPLKRKSCANTWRNSRLGFSSKKFLGLRCPSETRVSILGLLFDCCPPYISGLVVAHRIYTVYRRTHRPWTQLFKPLFKGREAELDMSVRVFVVCLYALAGFVITAPALLHTGIVFYPCTFPRACTSFVRTRTAGPHAVLSVELVYPYRRLLTAGAFHAYVGPSCHFRECGYSQYTT
jgi:hypothetical protein